MLKIADIEDLQKLETHEILKKLLELWPHIHKMHITLLGLNKGENFLTAMAMLQPGRITQRSNLKEIKGKTDLLAHYFFKLQKGNTASPDIQFLNKIWHLKTDSHLMQKIIFFFDRSIEIPSCMMQQFDHYLQKLYESAYDPILKLFYSHYLFSNVLHQLGIQEMQRLSRIFNIKVFGDLNFIRFPALYQEHLLNPTLKFNEENLYSFLYDLSSIIRLANIVLQHVTNLYKELIDNISHSEILSKVYKSPEFFPNIFSKPIISISDVIESMGWKRDKAARFLNQLAKTGYFSAEKIGREKVFFNLTLLRTVKDVLEDNSIFEILH